MMTLVDEAGVLKIPVRQCTHCKAVQIGHGDWQKYSYDLSRATETICVECTVSVVRRYIQKRRQRLLVSLN
jgi:hypothetical protein